MTTYGYARVSTKKQSTDTQEEYLRKAGAEEVRSETASGADLTRPVWSALMEELEEGDELIVVNLDRIARDAAYLLDFQRDILDARGVTLIYDNRRHNPRNRSDRMTYGIKALFAEDERLGTKERTTRTLTYMRESGEGRKLLVTDAVAKKVRAAQARDPQRTITSLAKEFELSRTTIRKILAGGGAA